MSTNLIYEKIYAYIVKRDIGIEPMTKGWKPLVLPLN